MTPADTGDQVARWWHCCDREFTDPMAEEFDGVLVGQCPECGAQLTQEATA